MFQIWAPSLTLRIYWRDNIPWWVESRGGAGEAGPGWGEGGYHMWPGPHSPTHPAHIPGCPTNPAFPTATKASPLPPTWVSSSKFSRRKSHAAVAPSLWCPNWHPETSGIPQNFWTSPITKCWSSRCAIPITFQYLISHQTHTKPSKDKDQYIKTKVHAYNLLYKIRPKY